MDGTFPLRYLAWFLVIDSGNGAHSIFLEPLEIRTNRTRLRLRTVPKGLVRISLEFGDYKQLRARNRIPYAGTTSVVISAIPDLGSCPFCHEEKPLPVPAADSDDEQSPHPLYEYSSTRRTAEGSLLLPMAVSADAMNTPENWLWNAICICHIIQRQMRSAALNEHTAHRMADRVVS